MELLFTFGGFVAGFIDAIAGGGGLITVPLTSLATGLGPDAVGTNKIAGFTAAFVALIVYWRKGHFQWQQSLLAGIIVWAGSLAGSFACPLFPPSSFRWLLVATCPLILWLLWRRDLWVQREQMISRWGEHGFSQFFAPRVVLCCFLAGFYDGAWGPGGGTLMFLTLFFVARFPLLTAIAGSKLMNTGSALVSLISYASRGYVHIYPGVWIAAGIGVGAAIGASLATANAARLVRPVLLCVVLLLLTRIYF